MKVKKILVILTGGRPKGNTYQLAEAFCQGALKAGNEVEMISLLHYHVNGCLGCNACRFGKACVQKDDFEIVASKMEWADMLVFASPLYFWTISARMKALIERFYCLARKDDDPPLGRYEAYPAKNCALLMTSADHYFWTFEQAVAYYRFTLVNYIGMHDCGMVLAGGCGETDGKPDIGSTDYLKKAFTFGYHII